MPNGLGITFWLHIRACWFILMRAATLPLRRGEFVTTYEQQSNALRIEQLQLISDTVPALFAYVDLDLRYKFCNRAYSDWFGLSREQIIGQSMVEVLGADAMRTIQPHLEQALNGQAADFEAEIAYKHGGPRWVHAIYTPHRNPQGAVIGLAILVTDVSERKRWESVLQHERDRLSLALTPGSMGVYELNFRDKTLWWSPELYYVFGVSPTSFTPTLDTFKAMLHPDDRDAFSQGMERSIVAHQPFVHEFRIVKPDGVMRWVSNRGKTEYDEAGIPICHFGVTIDVTQGKLAAEQLRRTEARHNTVLAHLREGMLITTTNPEPIYWNPAALAIFGYPNIEETRLAPEQFQRIFQLWTPDGAHQLVFDEWPNIRLRRGESVENCEFRLRRPDQGWERAILCSGDVVETSTGDKLIYLSMIDVTEQRRVEAALRTSKGRLRLFIEHAPAAIAMFDREMRYLAASQRWQQDYHLEGDLIGLSHYDVFPEITERWKEIHRRGLAGAVLMADEDQFVRTDGSMQWVKWEVRPWYEDQEKIGGILVAAEEVTAQVRAKRALHESEAVLRTVTNEAQVGLVMVDKERKYLFANHTYAEILGLPDENIIGKRVADVTSTAYDQIAPKLDAAFAGRRVRDELRFPTHPKGGERFYEAVYQPRKHNGDEPYVVIVIIDITERKRAEERMSEQRRVLKSVTDNATVALFIMDERQHCTFMNPAAETLTGFKLHEMRGRPMHGIIHHMHPDGAAFPIDECPIARVFSENTQEHGEDVFVHKDGHFYDVAFTASPIRESSGRPMGTVIEVRNITQEKRAAQELRLSEARHRQLAQALREADQRKDEFLAMLAHELRNPLAPICNAIQIFRHAGTHDQKQDQTFERAHDMIERQVNQLVRLVDDLLDVSRVSRGKITLQRTPVDLAEVIRLAVETTRPMIDARHHELKVTLPPESMRVNGDLTRLAQVVGNLLNNAAKYTDDGGKIALTVERAPASNGNSSEAIIRVIDNGRGIDPKAQRDLFELFYQVDRNLDRSEGGLGIGLSLVKSLVELHGGWVEVRSAGRGMGSEFIVSLPGLLDELPAQRPELSASRPNETQRLRVLVVDDNHDSAETMAMLLEIEGYEILVAYDGKQAVDVALAERPDVVVLDIGLPYLNGYEACQAMRRGGLTDALLVAMTGYGQDEDRRMSQRAGFDAHLVKPVALSALQDLLASRRRKLPSAEPLQPPAPTP